MYEITFLNSQPATPTLSDTHIPFSMTSYTNLVWFLTMQNPGQMDRSPPNPKKNTDSVFVTQQLLTIPGTEVQFFSKKPHVMK